MSAIDFPTDWDEAKRQRWLDLRAEGAAKQAERAAAKGSKVVQLKSEAQRLAEARQKAERDLENWSGSTPEAIRPIPILPPEGKDETGKADPEDAKAKKGLLAAAGANAKVKIAALNKKHFVVNNIGGKCLIGEFIPSPIDPKCTILSLQSPAAFTTRYSNQKVGEINPENFKRTYKELGKYWLKHRDRLSYEGVDLVPNGEQILPGNRLNLWRGFGVEPKQGNYPLIRAHLTDILSNGDPGAVEYNWRWTAWAVQHPDEQAEVGLVFRGLKGTGKGFWGHVVRTIFGEHGLYISSPIHLVGNFNGHFEGCVFLFSDEAFAVADKRSESILKGLLTEPVLMVERKGIDARQVKNRLHILMAANQKWVVPASADERRFVVNESSPARRGDKAYFTALYEEAKNGGVEALLYDLLHTDLGDWHPRQIYETEALRQQKEHSLSGEEEWLEAVLQEGVIPGRLDQLDRATAKELVRDARDRIPKLRYVSETKFGMWLRKEWGCMKWRTAFARGWVFLPIAEMRAAWEKKFGGWNWDEEIEQWE